MTNSDLAIHAESISKIYRLGVRETQQESLASALLASLKSPLSNFRKYRSLYNFDDVENGESSDVLWAVRDLSLEVKEGEVLGIVGRNGAGKSTLLKLLTRITPPTKGRIVIRGRVSSLLEVGTGFHQELTGRENIYLNGTVLGMKKHEIDRKFDEIVEFSGVERFLDTPVKRYSSGMRVRLAFAVAAHLEPEILIIDEVLAVGDSAFQRKCIDKMQEVGESGRTVLFVSHNMGAVSLLCNRAVLMDAGRLVMSGSPHDVIKGYLEMGTGTSAVREWPDPSSAPGKDIARLRAVRIIAKDGNAREHINVNEEVGVQMVYDVLASDHRLLPHYYFYSEEGAIVFGALDQDPKWFGQKRPVGRYTSTVWIPANLLGDGRIFVNCALITRQPDIPQFAERQVVSFDVCDAMGGGTARGDWTGEMPGVIRPLLEWTTEYRPQLEDADPTSGIAIK